MARFVLWGTYCDDALQKREPFRDEHLNRLKQLKESGTLVTLGPTEGSTHVLECLVRLRLQRPRLVGG